MLYKQYSSAIHIAHLSEHAACVGITGVYVKRIMSVRLQYNPFGDLSTLLPEDNRIFDDNDGAIIAVS